MFDMAKKGRKSHRRFVLSIFIPILFASVAIWYYVGYRGNTWLKFFDSMSIWVVAIGVLVPIMAYLTKHYTGVKMRK